MDIQKGPMTFKVTIKYLKKKRAQKKGSKFCIDKREKCNKRNIAFNHASMIL
jgi:hypothetical protein